MFQFHLKSMYLFMHSLKSFVNEFQACGPLNLMEFLPISVLGRIISKLFLQSC